MADLRQVPRGTDLQVDITVKDSDTGLAVDLTAATGYAAFVYSDQEEMVARYSKNVLTGFYSITAIDEATGQIRIHLKKEDTINLDRGLLKVQVQQQLTVLGDEWRNISTPLDLCELIESPGRGAPDLG